MTKGEWIIIIISILIIAMAFIGHKFKLGVWGFP